MKNYTITASDPGSFAYDAENPTKYTEACSHAIHKILYGLSEQGFVVRQLEAADTSTYLGALSSYITDFAAWVDSAEEAAGKGNPIPARPTMPILPDALALLGASGVLIRAVSQGVDAFAAWLERRNSIFQLENNLKTVAYDSLQDFGDSWLYNDTESKALMEYIDSLLGLLQQVKDQEAILNIGDYAVWMKSAAVDHID